MDLKKINGFKILHLIDHAPRYSAATINKKKRLNLKSESSQGGFIILMCGGGKYATIAWKSNKLKMVVKSTLSAQTLALKGCVRYIFASFFLSVNESTYQTRKRAFYFT